ncbi:hypothetical protein N9948_01540 [bacterium]|nr:hypothetical protein [bacterium]
MKEIVYRVALNSLENNTTEKSEAEIEQAVYRGLDLIKEKRVRTLNEFYSFINKSQIGQKQFADAITKIVKKKKPERLIQLALFLGKGLKDSGVGLLKETWWERNLPDEVLKKIIAPKWWTLFRDKKWLDINNIIKN